MDNKLQTYYNLWSCILNDDKPKFIELENLDNEITHLENLILSQNYDQFYIEWKGKYELLIDFEKDILILKYYIYNDNREKIIQIQSYWENYIDKFDSNIDNNLNIGRFYYWLGQFYGKLNEYEIAIKFYKKSLLFFNKLNFKIGNYVIQGKIGEIMTKQGDLNKSKYHFREQDRIQLK